MNDFLPKASIMIPRKKTFNYDDDHDLKPRTTTPIGMGR
jgi:hypothetical protein